MLPCILPLLPIVVGVSVAGRSSLRPVWLALGMVLGFVGITFLLYAVLSQFVTLADIIHIGTFYVLLLFGVGFLTNVRSAQFAGAVLGALFFLSYGWLAVLFAGVAGSTAMELGGRVATLLQQAGTDAQGAVRNAFGSESPITSIVLGVTMGLVWVPCAGPALAFALTLVRSEPGLRAFLALTVYAVGAALPVLLLGYGGQYVVARTRALTTYSDVAKRIGGVILIVTAVALRFDLLQRVQTWFAEHTVYGTYATRLEEQFFPMPSNTSSTGSSLSPSMQLPRIIRAPEFTGLGPWHNSEPLTLKELKGKVVLVDFWTYSCINCIRTLPYVQGYWDSYKQYPFVLLGVHTPEFIFEKSEKNVADAITRHGLTYPIAQDNDFGTWNAFANRYWPAKYLIDAEGYVRYAHFGEGGYEETAEAVESLLAEIGVQTNSEFEIRDSGTPTGRDQTPETYVGPRSWPAFANGTPEPTTDPQDYTAPTSIPLNRYALTGTWQVIDNEYQQLTSDTGEIHLHFLGSEANLVLGMADPKITPHAEVTVDGKAGASFEVDRHDLFNLYKGEYGEHELVLKITGTGLQAYAFTFGSN